LDVEVISLTDRLLKELGIYKYQICLNSLGCPKDKTRLSQELRKRLKGQLAKFCPDCQNRFKRNIFRILDCKNSVCQKALSQLDLKQDYLCSDCQAHFQKVINGLKSINLSFQLSPLLVRGLDYYTRTVFEIKHSQLGAQDALGAGGRYDNLVEQLGGTACGAIGFAFGIERILLAGGSRSKPKDKDLVFIVTLGEPAEQAAARLLHNLRAHNIFADMDYTARSLKAQMRQANDLAARFCIIIGDNELAKGTVSLKDMVSGSQREVKQADLIKELS